MFGGLRRWLWRRVPHRHRYQAVSTPEGEGAVCRRCGFVGYFYARRKR